MSTPIPRMEKNPLQDALENYKLLERELHQTRSQNEQLRADNAGLVAENGVLREHLRTADNDRVRLQAIASTLLGRLFAINDVIGGAVRASVKEGIEATQAMKPEDEPAGAAQRVAVVAPPHTADDLEAPPAPPQRRLEAVGSSLPSIDFGRMPQNPQFRR